MVTSPIYLFVTESGKAAIAIYNIHSFLAYPVRGFVYTPPYKSPQLCWERCSWNRVAKRYNWQDSEDDLKHFISLIHKW